MPFPAYFFRYFCLFQHLTANMFVIKLCRRLDSNCGPLELEATALPTEPQPLPNEIPRVLCTFLLLSKFAHLHRSRFRTTKIFCLQFTNSISCKFVLIQTWTKIWIFFRRAAACIQTCFDSESVFRHPSVEGENGEAWSDRLTASYHKHLQAAGKTIKRSSILRQYLPLLNTV